MGVVEPEEPRLVVTPGEGHGHQRILKHSVRDVFGRSRPGKAVGTQLTVAFTVTGGAR